MDVAIILSRSDKFSSGMGETVTDQPGGKSTSVNVNVDLPKIDLEELNQGQWQTKMTDCLEDVPMCVFGCCCPCLMMWQSADKLGLNPLLYCLGVFCAPTMVALRVKTRQRLGIQADIETDVLNSGCCLWGCLSNCQVATELRKRL